MTEMPATPFTRWRRWGIAGFLVFGIGIAVGVPVGFLMGDQRGWIGGGLAGALTALVRISWPVRKEPWFWGVSALFAAGDVMAVYRIDWSFTESWNGHSYSGLMVLDLFMMMAAVYALYCLRYGLPRKAFAEEPDERNYGERNIKL